MTGFFPPKQRFLNKAWKKIQTRFSLWLHCSKTFVAKWLRILPVLPECRHFKYFLCILLVCVGNIRNHMRPEVLFGWLPPEIRKTTEMWHASFVSFTYLEIHFDWLTLVLDTHSYNTKLSLYIYCFLIYWPSNVSL